MAHLEGGYRLVGTSSRRDSSLPVVSIITVVYNSEAYIERTIQSVLNQTYPNIEHVILDGASKDNTLQIVKKFEGQIAFWKSEKDSGIYDAMNKAQDLATGDYVMFLNSGDEFSSNSVLSDAFALDSNADVYYGDTQITDIEGKPLRNRTHRPPLKLTWKDFRYGMLVCHQSIIIRKSLSEKYNTTYRIAADIDWAIRSIRNAKKIVNANIPISKFMEGGMSSIHHRKGLEERYKILNTHYGYIPNAFVHIYMVFRLLKYKFVN